MKNPQSKRDIAVDETTMEIFKELLLKLPTNIHGTVFFNAKSANGTLTNEATNKLLKGALNDWILTLFPFMACDIHIYLFYFTKAYQSALVIVTLKSKNVNTHLLDELEDLLDIAALYL